MLPKTDFSGSATLDPCPLSALCRSLSVCVSLFSGSLLFPPPHSGSLSLSGSPCPPPSLSPCLQISCTLGALTCPPPRLCLSLWVSVLLSSCTCLSGSLFCSLSLSVGAALSLGLYALPLGLLFLFSFLKIFVYSLDRESTSRGSRKGRNRLPTEQRAQPGFDPRTPRITTQAKGRLPTNQVTQVPLGFLTLRFYGFPFLTVSFRGQVPVTVYFSLCSSLSFSLALCCSLSTLMPITIFPTEQIGFAGGRQLWPGSYQVRLAKSDC